VSRYSDSLSAAWADHLAPREAAAPTVVSLFAGCGGSSLGYSMAGFSERLAVEWDDKAAATFRANFPDVPLFHGDVAKLSIEDALARSRLGPGDLDVLDGSPPCQGFSTAGKRDMADPRNVLFEEYCRLLRGFRPRLLVMENVSGLVKGKMRLTFVTILRKLKFCGYRVSARLLNAMYFGVPQSRQRLIFVGVREDLSAQSSHPRALRRAMGLRQAMGLRRGWGRIADGVKNKQFRNRFRSLDLPCVTLEKTRPPILCEGGSERELTLTECAAIGSFPPGFTWGAGAYQQIGNSVPPLFMKAIAVHLRGILRAASDATMTGRAADAGASIQADAC